MSRVVVSLSCFVVCLLSAGPGLAQAALLHTHGSFETGGVILALPPGDNSGAEATLEYQGPSDPDYRLAHPFTKYDANNLASSLFGLTPDTSYALRVQLSFFGGPPIELRGTLTTRPEFALPILADVQSVSDTASLQSAITSAGPAGREILVAPGVYGPIAVSGKLASEAAPIVVRAADPTARPVIDAGGATSGISLNNSAHLVFDGLEVRNAATHGVYLRSSHHIVVQNCFIHDNAEYNILISKNENATWGDFTTVGYHLIQDNRLLDGRHGVQLDNNPGAGTVIRRNIINGGRDNAKICGDETIARDMLEDVAHVLALTGSDQNLSNHDTEFYDNELAIASDDNIEVEGACVNARVYRNTLRDAVNPIGIAPLIPGPAFFLRNLISGDWGEGGVKMNTAGNGANPIRNAYFYHNTWARETAGPLLNLWYAVAGDHNVPVRNIVFRNNVLWAQAGGRCLDESNRGSEHPSFDYNCWYTSTVAPNLFEWWNGAARDNYASFAEFQAGTGESPNGGFGPPLLGADLRPLAMSPVIDAALVIPGINDEYAGAAPDRGAYEYEAGCTPSLPSGSVGNSLRAVRSADDVALSWSGATVDPPGFAVYWTSDKRELDETPTGIGDESQLAVTSLMSLVDSGVVSSPPDRFYQLLATDSCGGAVFP